MTIEENTLSSSDICAIIKTCGESGVQSFKYFGLDITFIGKIPNGQDSYALSPGPVTAIRPIEIDKSIFAQEEYNLKEDEIAELQLTDPYKYEQLIGQKELINE